MIELVWIEEAKTYRKAQTPIRIERTAFQHDQECPSTVGFIASRHITEIVVPFAVCRFVALEGAIGLQVIGDLTAACFG